MPRPVRLFVADSHPVFRAGVRSVLGEAGDVQVVGEASSGDETARRLRLAGADVALIDLDLVDLTGGQPALAGQPLPGLAAGCVLVVRPDVPEALLTAAVRGGMRGFVTRQATSEELHRAIDVVAAGGVLFSPVLAGRVRSCAVGWSGGRTTFPELTDRELEILRLLARGHDNRRIARLLVLSEKTVRNHVTRVFAKLRVSNRAEATARARDAGLGGPDAAPA